MPRNLTGGSGHKSQRNSEGNKARNNRVKGDLLLEDLASGSNTQGVDVGRVIKRLGCGRMEVMYFDYRGDACLIQAPLRGGLRGKGKKTVWVDLDSLVVIAETELGGKSHEIIAVMSPEQVAQYRKIVPDADPRLFVKGGTDSDQKDDGIEFDTAVEEEIDVDAI
jgi:hypothetical protein